MIRHTVLFRLHRPVEPQRAEAFVQRLRDFAAGAPHVQGETRVDAALGLRGESPRAADALLEATFADPAAFDAYIASEEHQALLKDVLEPSLDGWWSVQAEA